VTGKRASLGCRLTSYEPLSTDIKALGLPNVGLVKRAGKYYVELTLGQDGGKTAISARGSDAAYSESFYL
jgi:hypothetical protein